jgi:hypothetical protein
LVQGKGGSDIDTLCEYRRQDLNWSIPPGRPANPGLVIFAKIDGSFSLWDPERNGGGRSDTFEFDERRLWEGYRDSRDAVVCRGLLEDWETWSLKSNGAFSLLCEVLAELSPPGEAGLKPGPATRVPGLGDRDVPTLLMPYGIVPLPQAFAAIRRILSLAYMLVWAWTEHCAAAQQRGNESSGRIVLLWDEVEAHLHPQWQRVILPAVLRALSGLLKGKDRPNIQVIATSHAPFVLASMETLFHRDRDRLFNLELKGNDGKVELGTVEWAKYGDVIEWLRSPCFDMKSGYSKEAEEALTAANRWLRGQREIGVEEITQGLQRALGGSDPFWPRWLAATGMVK